MSDRDVAVCVIAVFFTVAVSLGQRQDRAKAWMPFGQKVSAEMVDDVYRHGAVVRLYITTDGSSMWTWHDVDGQKTAVRDGNRVMLCRDVVVAREGKADE